MQRALVDLPVEAPRGGMAQGVLRQLRNPTLLRATVTGTAFFFTFVGCFSYVVYRLERPPFDFGPLEPRQPRFRYCGSSAQRGP